MTSRSGQAVPSFYVSVSVTVHMSVHPRDPPTSVRKKRGEGNLEKNVAGVSIRVGMGMGGMGVECFCNGTYVCPPERSTNFCEEKEGRGEPGEKRRRSKCSIDILTRDKTRLYQCNNSMK